MKLISSCREARFGLAVSLALGVGLVAAPSAKAQQLTTLYSFCSQGGSGCTDGAYFAGQPTLVQGTDGNMYGTTDVGGAGAFCGSTGGCGTVFRVTPAGALTTIYSFCSQLNCADGSTPVSGLVLGTDGSFYGTTYGGGGYPCGVNTCIGNGSIFEITPGGTLTTLGVFSDYYTTGGNPTGGLVQGTDGNFYGTTSVGGPHGKGTVFKITPGGALTTLYGFSGPDGSGPGAALIQASDGNFYGVTGSGGTAAYCQAAGFGTYGCGTVFEISPGGSLTTIYNFCSQPNCMDGYIPSGALVQGTDGNLYGTTAYGGGNPYAFGGTVFRITPKGEVSTLYNFGTECCVNGDRPFAGLVQGTDGNFYGTTFGHDHGEFYGSIFSITTTGRLTTLYGFCPSGPPCTDGDGPVAGLVQGSDGGFYGVTSQGGANGHGTVFRLALIPIASVSPTSLTFASQDVGTTSPPQTLTLSNTGTAALSVSSIVPSGDFAQKNDCGSSVAIGGGCTISVSFKPGAVGTRTGAINITDNAAGSPQAVGLTGTGIGRPSLTASVVSKSKAGSTLTLTLKLTNTGTGDAQNTYIKTVSTHTLGGTGTVTYLGPALPIAVGNVAVGASTTVVLKFNVPSTVTKFSLAENGTTQDAIGNTLSFAGSQVVFP